MAALKNVPETAEIKAELLEPWTLIRKMAFFTIFSEHECEHIAHKLKMRNVHAYIMMYSRPSIIGTLIIGTLW